MWAKAVGNGRLGSIQTELLEAGVQSKVHAGEKCRKIHRKEVDGVPDLFALYWGVWTLACRGWEMMPILGSWPTVCCCCCC